MNLATINYIMCMCVCVCDMYFICIYSLCNSALVGCYVKI